MPPRRHRPPPADGMPAVPAPPTRRAPGRPRLLRGSKGLRMVHAGPKHAKDHVARNGHAFTKEQGAGILPLEGGAMAARQRRFTDRVEAGERLAEVLARHVRPPVIVLAIPRGGAIVGACVAERLGAPMDVVVPRKVGAPGNPELAVGAVAEGVEAIDEAAVRRLGLDMAAVRAEAAPAPPQGKPRPAAQPR